MRYDLDHPVFRRKPERTVDFVKAELDILTASLNDGLITADDHINLATRLIKPWDEPTREELYQHIASWAVRITER